MVVTAPGSQHVEERSEGIKDSVLGSTLSKSL